MPHIARILIIAMTVSFGIILSAALALKFSAPNPTNVGGRPSSPPKIVSVVPTSHPTEASSVIVSSQPVEIAANPASFQKQPVENQIAYGHFSYAQANPSELMIVSSYATGDDQRFELLNIEAGQALMRMMYSAREEGVWIVPVSGFRTIEQQQKLFQDQVKRRGSVEAAAKISAPAGFSEHHTGFAVDLADGRAPKQDVTLEFEKTNAYRWLTRHAREFGFELSFKRNNSQGVSFEPWHWRYVGSPNAIAAFAHARK
uniref:D-alanyl-D-alanine carboxypeptidase-like core domain-containing protein n=1 Tax=Tolypothrix bouteillei VB521301 TaxID=1479485 RepID=A0A0C1R759_9CYAN